MQKQEEKNKVLQEFEGLLSTLKTQNNNSNALRDKLINLIRTHIDPNSEYIKKLQGRGDFYPQITKYEYNNELTRNNLNYAEKVIVDCIDKINKYGLYKTPEIINTSSNLKQKDSLTNWIIAIATVFTVIIAAVSSPCIISFFTSNPTTQKPAIFKNDTLKKHHSKEIKIHN